MKTTAILLVSVFMVIPAIKTHAQVTGAKPNPKNTSVISDAARNQSSFVPIAGTSFVGVQMPLQGVEGQIYIGADWPLGRVELRDGSAIDTYYLRYNLLADQMQFINGKDTLAFASPKELKNITLAGHTFVYETYQCENTIRQGYFEVLEPGKNRLLLKRVVTYLIPDENNPDSQASTRYLVDKYYFLGKPGIPAVKLLCNRKSVLSALGDFKSEMEHYLKKTGNKVHDAADLSKLVAYYNTLDRK